MSLYLNERLFQASISIMSFTYDISFFRNLVESLLSLMKLGKKKLSHFCDEVLVFISKEVGHSLLQAFISLVLVEEI